MFFHFSWIGENLPNINFLLQDQDVPSEADSLDLIDGSQRVAGLAQTHHRSHCWGISRLEHLFFLIESGMLEVLRHRLPAYPTLGCSPNMRSERRRFSMTKRHMAFGVICFLVG